jgi:hypothetical protein
MMSGGPRMGWQPWRALELRVTKPRVIGRSTCEPCGRWGIRVRQAPKQHLAFRNRKLNFDQATQQLELNTANVDLQNSSP